MDSVIYESDWESFSEYGSSEDQEEINFEYGGKAQSILSSLEESIRKIDDFLLYERDFALGDVVSSITDPSGQMGKVVKVNMVVDLENVHGTIIRDVDSKKLLKVLPISEGDYVIHGPWLGKVNKVVDCVTVLLDDGAKCKVIAADRQKLLPLSPSLLEEPQYFYPGQRVLVSNSSVPKTPRWLCGSCEGNPDKGTVCSVEAEFVYVSWLASALTACGPSCPAPPTLQDPKNLTLLPCFSQVLWQVGDYCLYPFANSKEVMENDFCKLSHLDLYEAYAKLDTSSVGKETSMNFENPFSISRTKITVDVLWQDGSLSPGLESKTLFPVNIMNAHEFWPEQYVLEKTLTVDPHISKDQRWGVVKSMDSQERTVKVVWRNIAANVDAEMDRLEEIVSAYELVEHPDYSYCLGDIVCRMQKNSFLEEADQHADSSYVITESSLGDEAAFQASMCCREQSLYPFTCYLSKVGVVTGFKDGSVEVRWANGKITEVAPYEIFRVTELSSSDSVRNEDNVEDHERKEHDRSSLYQKEKKLLDASSVGEDKTFPWACRSLSFPKAAIGFFTNITASLFGSHGSTSLSSSFSSIEISEGANKFEVQEKLESHGQSCLDQPSIVNDLQRGTHDGKDFPFLSSIDRLKQFKQFDLVSDCSDHHFIDCANKKSQVKRDWLKKVQQEWSILDKDLPESIYVRLYEERMDLLRAAIVGAHGTPYQDALFFFDIFLPPGYPDEAPMVHYDSGGLRLNPNLYESGKVCLSLLNTWTGMGSEVWNPGKSTILQVLLSLQALVLNEKPYFNEAGYELQMGRAEGEKNSVSYNENAFLVTCKSMLYVLRKPPKHFEALVEEHFRQRSQHIVTACKAYIEGAPVGYTSGDKSTQVEGQVGTSKGFKIMLAKLLPMLVEAFIDKGIVCSL